MSRTLHNNCNGVSSLKNPYSNDFSQMILLFSLSLFRLCAFFFFQVSTCHFDSFPLLPHPPSQNRFPLSLNRFAAKSRSRSYSLSPFLSHHFMPPPFIAFLHPNAAFHFPDACLPSTPCLALLLSLPTLSTSQPHFSFPTCEVVNFYGLHPPCMCGNTVAALPPWSALVGGTLSRQPLSFFLW